MVVAVSVAAVACVGEGGRRCGEEEEEKKGGKKGGLLLSRFLFLQNFCPILHSFIGAPHIVPDLIPVRTARFNNDCRRHGLPL